MEWILRLCPRRSTAASSPASEEYGEVLRTARNFIHVLVIMAAASIKRFPESGTFLMFVEEFLLKNEPCIFGESVTMEWKARRLWQGEGGRPDFEYLRKEFGDVVVPVADCTIEQFASHPKVEMKFADFIGYWRVLSTSRGDPPNTCTDSMSSMAKKSRLLYLKDWHFVRDFPGYVAYTVPDFFHSDWLNEVWDLRRDVGDDYRFVYMGPRGTWTPFHADVFRSYSWSANVCGRKEWLLYPPGEEDHLRNYLGSLPFDVTSPELNDQKVFPNAGRACKPICVVQGPGEVIFVPSGWHHQVRNLEDTISINHNWVNAFSLPHMWRHLKKELKLVQLEISDCRGMDGWEQQCQVCAHHFVSRFLLVATSLAGQTFGVHETRLQPDSMKDWVIRKPFMESLPKPADHTQDYHYLKCCLQLILKASAGMDYKEFFQFLCLVALPRLKDFDNIEQMTPKSITSGSRVCFSDLNQFVTTALTSKVFTFFGNHEELPEDSPHVVTRRLDLPTASDDMTAVIQRSLQRCECSLSIDSKQFPMKELLHELPETVSAVLRQNCEADSAGLCMIIRAFELHRVWSVMQELLGSIDFNI